MRRQLSLNEGKNCRRRLFQRACAKSQLLFWILHMSDDESIDCSSWTAMHPTHTLGGLCPNIISGFPPEAVTKCPMTCTYVHIIN